MVACSVLSFDAMNIFPCIELPFSCLNNQDHSIHLLQRLEKCVVAKEELEKELYSKVFNHMFH